MEYKIKKNPEGFATAFVSIIKEVVADNIAKYVEYEIDPSLETFDVKEIFPKSKKYPQKELLEGSDWSLYDYVQWDSDIEQRFITNKLNEDDQILCYFKFPGKFKIGLPNIIGNYNFDWGVIRKDENGVRLELVRETIGDANTANLQWPNEIRKIKCAQKHFAKVGIDY